MSVGQKRERVEIQRATETADAEGQPVKDPWLKVVTVWARVESLTGREFESVKAISSEISKRFTVNYRRDLTVKMRVVWLFDRSAWNIHDIQPDETKFDMAIYASRVK